MHSAQAVYFGDKLYVGGGYVKVSYPAPHPATKESREADLLAASALYLYSPASDAWATVKTPVHWFGIAIYHSKLLLVGGLVGAQVGGDNVWTYCGHGNWKSTIPSMKKKRLGPSCVGYEKYLLVLGGELSDPSDSLAVEVFNGDHWMYACSLDMPHDMCLAMKSVVMEGIWYLMGGVTQDVGVFCASLESLVASCGSLSEGYVWEALPDLPNNCSSPAILLNQLIAVGGESPVGASSAIYAYSPDTESWEPAGNLPEAVFNACTAVLPTGELMVIGGSDSQNFFRSKVFKGKQMS